MIVVSRRLGHAKPSITLDIYGHLIPSMQAEAAQKIDELITPVEIIAEMDRSDVTNVKEFRSTTAPNCTRIAPSGARLITLPPYIGIKTQDPHI